MEKMKKIFGVVFCAVLLAVAMCGCSAASTVNHNLSQSANNFDLYRKITVMNARTDTIMLEVEGYMALTNNSSNELVVTIKTGEDEYYKDYIYLNDWTCYIMEQLEPTSADPYHYEISLYPEQLILEYDVHTSLDD